MAVLQMQRISICALKKNRKAILETIQRRGVLELSNISLEEDEDFFEKMDTAQAKSSFDRNAAFSTQALEVLDTYAPVKSSMLAMFEGRTALTVREYENRVEKRENALGLATKINMLAKKVAENKAEIVKRRTQLEALEPWMTLDVSLRFTGTKKTAAFIGSFADQVTMEELYQKIAELAPTANVNIDLVSSSIDQICVFVVCHIDHAQAVENALRSSGFIRPASPPKEAPAQRRELLNKYIAQAEGAITEAESEIVSFANARDELLFLVDDFTMRSEKYAIISNLAQSRRAFVLSGYVPQRYASALESELTQKFDVAVNISNPAEDDDNVPVLLKNNSFAEPVEGVLESYSLPARGEVDPTSIMAIFYYIFFGLMLSDFAYGAMMFIGTALILMNFKNIEQGMRNMMKMFCFCGISTMFWGVMFGSYFGNVFDQVATTFFGVELAAGQHIVNPIWFEPLSNPMRMLTFCVFLGLIHLFVGQALNAYMCLQQKRFKDFMFNVSVYLLVGGGVLFGLTTPMVCSILGLMKDGQPFLPASMGTILGWVACAGAIGIILTGGNAKNPGAAIGLGAYALYNNVTGYLSDLLSYSRLLALGLATGVIGTVINQMGAMGGGGFVGAILFIIVFIFGHLANFGINALGAYVHTNRLQYVEFFGKFYEGGGRTFAPFAAHTKYYKFKED